MVTGCIFCSRGLTTGPCQTFTGNLQCRISVDLTAYLQLALVRMKAPGPRHLWKRVLPSAYSSVEDIIAHLKKNSCVSLGLSKITSCQSQERKHRKSLFWRTSLGFNICLRVYLELKKLSIIKMQWMTGGSRRGGSRKADSPSDNPEQRTVGCAGLCVRNWDCLLSQNVVQFCGRLLHEWAMGGCVKCYEKWISVIMGRKWKINKWWHTEMVQQSPPCYTPAPRRMAAPHWQPLSGLSPLGCTGDSCDWWVSHGWIWQNVIFLQCRLPKISSVLTHQNPCSQTNLFFGVGEGDGLSKFILSLSRKVFWSGFCGGINLAGQQISII